MTEKQGKVLQQAIETYGKASQVDMAIEEMSELTKALCKERRNTNSDLPEIYTGAILEEIADVLIMLEQLLIIFDSNKEVQGYVEWKLKRLEQRLQNK